MTLAPTSDNLRQTQAASGTAPHLLSRFRGCLLGLATGDALGCTLEFRPRGTFQPLEDMVGGGPFRLQAGQWTDDTAMALCLATSLIECQGFDAHDQMLRYCRWMDEGYLSSNGRCFDIGHTTAAALRAFQHTGNPYAGSDSAGSAGNGSLMRLAPIALFYFPDIAAADHHAIHSSLTTHGARECLDACRLLARMLCRALAGHNKHSILLGDAHTLFASDNITGIARGDYLNHPQTRIHGSGYVVESLEAALWCFANTDSFQSAVLAAANLGDDADTTAAICGQLAGAHYGEDGIPEHWLQRLTLRDRIGQLAEQLHATPSDTSQGNNAATPEPGIKPCPSQGSGPTGQSDCPGCINHEPTLF